MEKVKSIAKALQPIDADEILAVRENLQAAIRSSDGPPNRRIPETLCQEIDAILEAIELTLRSSS